MKKIARSRRRIIKAEDKRRSFFVRRAVKASNTISIRKLLLRLRKKKRRIEQTVITIFNNGSRIKSNNAMAKLAIAIALLHCQGYKSRLNNTEADCKNVDLVLTMSKQDQSLFHNVEICSKVKRKSQDKTVRE